MHRSAMVRMSWFVDNYIKGKGHVRVLDVGSCDVNGSMRPLFEGTEAEYVGLDIEAGANVDIVMKEPYDWSNIPDESFDFVISANAFEHIEFPWLTIKEIYRKLKPEGIACIHAPLSVGEHKHPTDCYRYYPDGFRALGKWAGFQVLNVTAGGVPSMSAPKDWNGWNDTMMILLKSDTPANPEDYPILKYERREGVIIVDSDSVLISCWRTLRYTMPKLHSLIRKFLH